METIEFSKDEKGTILSRVRGTSLFFEQIIEGNVKVGKSPEEPIETKILAELNFYQIESVNSVIEQLEKVKANLTMLSAC